MVKQVAKPTFTVAEHPRLVGWVAGLGCELADVFAVVGVVADDAVATLGLAAKAVVAMSGSESTTAAVTTMAETTDRNLPGGCMSAPPRGSTGTHVAGCGKVRSRQRHV
jgi:hypothetical protein